MPSYVRSSPSGRRVIVSGEPGPPGPAGAAGTAVDEESAFSSSSDPVSASTFIGEPGTTYTLTFQGQSYYDDGTTSGKTRQFSFEISIAIDILGNVEEQRPIRGSVSTGGYGNVDFDFSEPLTVRANFYGKDGYDLQIRSGFNATLTDAAGGSIPEGWYPTEQGELVFCFDAAAGVAVNGSSIVTGWSGQQGAVLATGTTCPFVASNVNLGNNPAVKFSDVLLTSMLIAGLSHSASDYIFNLVVDMKSLDTDSYAIDIQTGRLIMIPDRNSNQISYLSGASFKNAGSASSTGPQQITWMLKAGTGNNEGRIRKNAADIASNLGYVQAAIGGTSRLGSNFSGNASRLDGEVSMFTCYASSSELIRYYQEVYNAQRFAL